MRLRTTTTLRSRRATGLVACAVATLALSACTGSAQDAENDENDDAPVAAAGSNDEEGETVTIGFSAPAADHGWMAAITNNVRDLEEQYPDIDLQIAEGTNDVNAQISLVETFINDEVDAIVLLPFDGAAMTPIALEAMEAGITVINVDREFDDPNAARVTVLGDNYGMGVSAGEYMCQELGDNPDAVIAEIQGIAALPLTVDRSQGFEDALSECGLEVSNQVAADFTVEGGEEAAANLLQAAPQIDAIWNHDDDQGVGVLAAIENAGRDEFFMVGGAGSQQAMESIQSGEGVLRATVIYPSTQGADGVKLARLVEQGKSMSDLVEIEVPRLVQLYAPVVTADNVDQFIESAFRS
jgi:ribose transport system substrate-binding protein